MCLLYNLDDTLLNPLKSFACIVAMSTTGESLLLFFIALAAYLSTLVVILPWILLRTIILYAFSIREYNYKRDETTKLNHTADPFQVLSQLLWRPAALNRQHEEEESAHSKLFTIVAGFLLDKLLFRSFQVPTDDCSPEILQASSQSIESRPVRRRSLSSPKRPASVSSMLFEDDDKTITPTIIKSTSGSTSSSARSSFLAASASENRHVQFKSPLFSIMTFAGSPTLSHQDMFSDDDFEDELFEENNDMFRLTSGFHNGTVVAGRLTEVIANDAAVANSASHDDTIFDSSYVSRPRWKGKGVSSVDQTHLNPFQIREEQPCLLAKQDIFFPSSSVEFGVAHGSWPPATESSSLQQQLVPRLNSPEAALVMSNSQWYR